MLQSFPIDQYFMRITSPASNPQCSSGIITGAGSATYNLPCKMCIVTGLAPTAINAPVTLSCLPISKSLQ